MHTIRTAGTTFIHHGDFSGDVILVVPLDRVEIPPHAAGEGPARHVIVSMCDLVEFVAEYVRQQKIAALEDAKPVDVLGVPSRRTR